MIVMHAPKRAGVTLIEVLFSIGVILIGLVGLISVLPVAGHQARDSVGFNHAAALASAASAELQARGYHRQATWAILSDTLSAPTPTLYTAATGFPTDGVCIDPMFVGEVLGRVSEFNGTNPGYFATFAALGTNGYRRALFPFYKNNYNPLVDPSLPVASNNAWPTTPRMSRVTIDRDLGTTGAQLLSASEANLFGESGDDLAMASPEDDSLSPVASGQTALPTGIAYGKRMTEGRYSWIATVNTIDDSGYANLSVVVIRSRDRSYYTRTNPEGVASTPDDNAASERLAYVSFASGFSGGAGGTVEIVAAANTVSDVRTNDWVMLSRNVAGNAVHRWYRVTGAIDDAKMDRYADPVHGGTPRDVWRRRLMLDGPDWTFGFTTPGFADGTVADNTVMTLVEGVISVSEHTIKVGG